MYIPDYFSKENSKHVGRSNGFLYNTIMFGKCIIFASYKEKLYRLEIQVVQCDHNYVFHVLLEDIKTLPNTEYI